MNLQLQQSRIQSNRDIKISGSKSETNRLLLLQALYPRIVLGNVSNSDDSEVMAAAIASPDPEKDIHHAGTAMRFLTAYFAIQEGTEVVLTGSNRMKERPIKILVSALRQLGAEIEYAEKEGFPPLKIIGKKINKNEVTLPADVSSQYISALLLIAPKLENGLELTLEGQITSMPYLEMTLQLLTEIGVSTSFIGNRISVKNFSKLPYSISLEVESDWSSASYYYSIIALSETGTEIRLSSFKQNSLQGDAALAELYRTFGVETAFNDKSILLRKIGLPLADDFNWNLNKTPDIAQTIAVTCFGLGMGCHLTGLHTLKIKETDRLEALKTELGKLGANVTISEECFAMKPSSEIQHNVTIATYQDHRMAMAFAPLALKCGLVIENAEVVSKSYPEFWNDLKSIGFEMQEI